MGVQRRRDHGSDHYRQREVLRLRLKAIPGVKRLKMCRNLYTQDDERSRFPGGSFERHPGNGHPRPGTWSAISEISPDEDLERTTWVNVTETELWEIPRTLSMNGKVPNSPKIDGKVCRRPQNAMA